MIKVKLRKINGRDTERRIEEEKGEGKESIDEHQAILELNKEKYTLNICLMYTFLLSHTSKRSILPPCFSIFRFLSDSIYAII